MRHKLARPFKAVWNKSWTKLLGWSQGVSGATLLSVSQLNTFITNPTFKSYLDMIDLPKSITIAIMVIGLITWLAHGRK